MLGNRQQSKVSLLAAEESAKARPYTALSFALYGCTPRVAIESDSSLSITIGACRFKLDHAETIDLAKFLVEWYLTPAQAKEAFRGKGR